MNLLAWNCHGLGNQMAVHALTKLIQLKEPELVFLSETKLKVGGGDGKQFVKSFTTKEELQLTVRAKVMAEKGAWP